MSPQNDQDYKRLLTEVIQKQIMLLGPTIAVSKARQVPGITVADDGTVTAFTGNPQELTHLLIEQFVELSGLIVRKTMEPLLSNYPGLTTVVSVTAPSPTQPVMPQSQASQQTQAPALTQQTQQQVAQPQQKVVN